MSALQNAIKALHVAQNAVDTYHPCTWPTVAKSKHEQRARDLLDDGWRTRRDSLVASLATAEQTVAELSVEADSHVNDNVRRVACDLLLAAPYARLLAVNSDGGFTVWRTDGGAKILGHVANVYASFPDCRESSVRVYFSETDTVETR